VTEDLPEMSTTEPRAGMDVRAADQDHTLAAVHRLEAALGSAAPGRREAWRQDVVTALDALERATRDEERHAERPEGLLSEIARSQPMLRHRVHGLRSQYRHVRDTITHLRGELSEEADFDVADVRQRLGWVLTALRYQRAREADLIYDAFDSERSATEP
jgi:hypothetical protein